MQLDTPALVVDLPRLQKNIRNQADMAARGGIALRPHVKTHKCLEIARMQIEAGAQGITVATLSEAEVFASAGFLDILIAYPLYLSPEKVQRARRLFEAATVVVGVDSEEGAKMLASSRVGPVRVAIEIDSGQHRTGVRAERAADLGRACERMGLEVVGVFTHGGHSYAGASNVDTAANDEVAAVAEAADALADAGIQVEQVSVGSSPTRHHMGAGKVTEQRPGSYVFNDRQQRVLESCTDEEISLQVAATVVSRSPGRIVVDAGSKSLTAEVPPTLEGYGAVSSLANSLITRVSEHHGMLDSPRETAAVGDVLLINPNHVCTVVNLHSRYEVFQDGEQVDSWEILARGKNQ